MADWPQRRTNGGNARSERRNCAVPSLNAVRRARLLRARGADVLAEGHWIGQRRLHLADQAVDVLRPLGPSLPILDTGEGQQVDLLLPRCHAEASSQIGQHALAILRVGRDSHVRRDRFGRDFCRVDCCSSDWHGVRELCGRHQRHIVRRCRRSFQQRNRMVCLLDGELVGTIQQRTQVDLRIQHGEHLFLTDRQAVFTDAGDFDRVLREPEAHAGETSTACHGHRLHGGIRLLQYVYGVGGQLDQSEAPGLRHRKKETRTEITLSLLVLWALVRIAHAIGNGVVLAQDDGAAAEQSLCALRALIDFRRGVHLAIPLAVRPVVRKVLKTPRAPHLQLVGHVGQPVVEGKDHRKAPELESVAAIFAVLLKDFFGSSRVREVRTAAREPPGVLGYQRISQFGSALYLNADRFERLAARQHGVVDFDGLRVGLCRLGKHLDARADLANDRRPGRPFLYETARTAEVAVANGSLHDALLLRSRN